MLEQTLADWIAKIDEQSTMDQLKNVRAKALEACRAVNDGVAQQEIKKAADKRKLEIEKKG